MKIQTLLRHVADNLDNDRIAGYGLLYRNRESDRQAADLIDWQKPENYTLGDELPQEPEQFVPVVGEECEFNVHLESNPASFVVVTVISIIEGRIYFYRKDQKLNSCGGRVIKSNNYYHDFRPIKTEREKVINAALNGLTGEFDGFVMDTVIGQLYDAGMLVMPESK